MLRKHVIVGIHITDRMKNATAVQKVFTDHGCSIRTRLGLHDTGDGFCSPSGVLLLEFVGDDEELKAMEDQLEAIEGIEIHTMIFDHP
jgi:hypothetical protein